MMPSFKRPAEVKSCRAYYGASLFALIFLNFFAQFSFAADKLPIGDTIYGLLQDCKIVEPKAEMEMLNWATCRSYISGIRDALSVNGVVRMKDRIHAIGICGQERNLPIEAYIQVFITWAERHPELWGDHKHEAIVALTEKWPCP